MAYNYFPATYQPMMPQTMPQTVPQTVPQSAPQNNSGLIWVQGEAAAKSYLVAPNATVVLFDTEGDKFYMKSADSSGMPLPLRTFAYTETKETVTEAPQKSASFTREDFDAAAADYVRKSEFEKLKAEIETLTAKKVKKKDDE